MLSKWVADNGLRLKEVGDFEALSCLPAMNLIRSTKFHLSTEPAFCQTPVISRFSICHSCQLVQKSILSKS